MITYGPILKKFLLKCQAKLDFVGDTKIIPGKYPSYPGKTNITKVNFVRKIFGQKFHLNVIFRLNLKAL
jgi:hypothetical protein